MEKEMKQGVAGGQGVANQEIPMILQRGITKDEFMPHGEATSIAKTGTWQDPDQD